MANQLPGTLTTVQGPLHAVPCPHCGGFNDLREMQAQQLLDTGHRFLCDHCERSMEVLSIRPVTVVVVRKSQDLGTIGPGGLARRATAPAAPKPTGILAGVKKLLGGPK